MGKHQHLHVSFTLVVDDLGVKHIEKKIAKHLVDILRQQYKKSTDWSGKNNLGLDIEWNYE